MTVHRLISIFVILILVIGLITVRFMEATLFPDPLLDYFHSDFQNIAIPSNHAISIVLVTALRFLVNTTLSMGVLWFLYKKRVFIKAALWVYLFAFFILMGTMLCAIFIDGPAAKMVLFYSRRFLIHPILLFILVAGFYYLRNKELR